MAQQSQVAAGMPPIARLRPSQGFLVWLGVAPFFIFALMFLILPTGYLLVGAFQDPDGNFTLANIGDLFQPSILSAYWVSIEVSAASAIGGAFDRLLPRLCGRAGRPAALDPADA